MNEDVQIANAIYESLKDKKPIQLGTKCFAKFNLKYKNKIYQVSVDELPKTKEASG